MESSRVDVLYVTCRWREIGWSVVGKNSPVLYIIVAYVCVCANVWVMCGCKGGTLTVVARACVFMADQCTLLFMGW